MRARNIKPGFFKNEDLSSLSPHARLLFVGLWTLADKEGRLEDRPLRIRAELFPYEEQVEVERILTDLHVAGFVFRYAVDGRNYIQIVSWAKHQSPHHREQDSDIPPCQGYEKVVWKVSVTARRRILERDGYRCRECGATERLTIDHVVPQSHSKGHSNDDNLQTLCLSCNIKKSNKISVEQKPSNSGASPCLGREEATSQVASCPTDSLIPDSLIPDSLIGDVAHLPDGTEASQEEPPDPTHPNWLAREFRNLVKRAFTKHDELPHLASLFGELIRQGVPPPAILADIRDKARNRAEMPWALEKRLLARFKPREPPRAKANYVSSEELRRRLIDS